MWKSPKCNNEIRLLVLLLLFCADRPSAASKRELTHFLTGHEDTSLLALLVGQIDMADFDMFCYQLSLSALCKIDTCFDKIVALADGHH
jgi:hypothetical protein